MAQPRDQRSTSKTNPSPSVLVVDDDPDIREMVGIVLESAGHSVTTAENGADALRQLHRDEPIGLILLDMMMPEMDGWSFREEQQREPPLASIPVIVLTGDGRAAEKAEQLGAAGYLRKPLDLRDLLHITQAYLAATPR